MSTINLTAARSPRLIRRPAPPPAGRGPTTGGRMTANASGLLSALPPVERRKDGPGMLAGVLARRRSLAARVGRPLSGGLRLVLSQLRVAERVRLRQPVHRPMVAQEDRSGAAR